MALTRAELINEYFKALPGVPAAKLQAAAVFADKDKADQDADLKAWTAERKVVLEADAASRQAETDAVTQLATEIDDAGKAL